MVRPLEDIRVLDLSRIYAAPAGTMLLADLGAEVIRIEPPQGSDSMRDWGPFQEGESTYYFSANKNKKSITLNLKEEKGKELFLDILKKSDVVVDNFKTGTMEKLGLSYTRMKDINPKIISCSVTGFGHTGPLSNAPGFDPVIQAISGLMDVTGPEDGEATRVGVPIVDILTSVYVALSITAAIRQRDLTGEGQEIDLSLLDVQMSSLANITSAYINTGMISKRLGNQHNNVTPYQVFESLDHPIMICAGNDSLFGKLSTLLNHPEWSKDPRYSTNTGRKKHEAELTGKISCLLKEQTAEYWLTELSKAGIPAGRVNNIEQAMELEQITARETVEVMRHPVVGDVKAIKNPMRFSGLEIGSALAPPLLGEHTELVLAELLSLEKDKIEELKSQKVI